MPKAFGWSEDNVSLTALAARQYQPSNAIDVPDRTSLGTGAMGNQTLRFTFFTPTRTLTVNTFTTVCTSGATDTGGTTTRKIGLYTVNSSYTQVTCVARTANDPNFGSIGNTTNSASRYVKQFTTGDTGYASSYTLQAGTTYAVGILFANSGGTFGAPSFVTFGGAANLWVGSDPNFLPMMIATANPVTDITNTPISITGATTSVGIYCRLSYQ